MLNSITTLIGQGHGQGSELCKRSIAKQMLEQGIDANTIAKITNLQVMQEI